MGLRYDPFVAGATENELAPDFGTIYVDPRPSLLDTLRRATSAFVFADYGMGKTATRLALEYLVRNTHDEYPTLCVRYTPRVRDLLAGSADELRPRHLGGIIREMTTDLIVQALERLSERSRSGLQPFSEEQMEALRHQARAMPSALRRALHSAGDDGPIWRGIRPVVRHVAITPQWSAVVRQLVAEAEEHPSPPLLWQDMIEDIERLEFSRVFLLVDAIDEDTSHPERQHAVIKPLMDMLRDFQRQGIFLKCFLPKALERIFYEQYERQIRILTVQPEIATIAQSSPDHLDAIISERLQAAGQSNASFRNLDWFKSQEIEGGIQSYLVDLAQGSPRRVIELASHFLDFHSAHGFHDNARLWISAAEWRAFLEYLRRLSLAPP